MSTELQTMQNAILAREVSLAVAAEGVPADRVAGVAALIGRGFSVDASGGLARILTPSGRGVAEEVRAQLADPSIRPLTGLPSPPKAIPGVEPGSYADGAIRQEQARSAPGSNPYNPTSLFGRPAGPAPFIGHGVHWEH